MDQKPKFSKVLTEFFFTPWFVIIICILLAAILISIISLLSTSSGEDATLLVGALICLGVIIVCFYLRVTDEGNIPESKRKAPPEKVLTWRDMQWSREEKMRILTEVYIEQRKLNEERIEREVSKAVSEYQKIRHEWAGRPDPEDIPDTMDENGYFYLTIDEANQIGQPLKRGGY